MKLDQLPEAERWRKQREHLQRQMKDIKAPCGDGLPHPSLFEAIVEHRELVPVIQELVLHQLSWSIYEANAMLQALGVDVAIGDAPG